MSLYSTQPEQLRKHQLMLLDMLHQIDEVCKRNNISYMLYAGTALGAVRHRGFIPWDDDLDVIMSRSAYEKFLSVAEKELDSKKYFLQKEYSDHWPMFFSKLRRNQTACIERFVPKDSEMHQGVYIDIFPWDNLSDNQLIRKVQFIASKFVISDALRRRGYLTNSLLKKIVMQLSRIVPLQFCKRIVQLTECNDTLMVHGFFAANSKYEKSIFPREWMENTVDLPFEDGVFPVSEYYDQMLTTLYGDYMVPPPEEMRLRKVHGVIIDLENSHDKYIDIQKNMPVTEYERSIR